MPEFVRRLTYFVNNFLIIEEGARILHYSVKEEKISYLAYKIPALKILVTIC